jgi:hypothetical protein
MCGGRIKSPDGSSRAHQAGVCGLLLPGELSAFHPTPEKRETKIEKFA